MSSKDAPVRVAIVGLGYVGLTLGVALARRGLSVVGVERRSDVIKLTNDGVPHFAEEGLQSALQDVVRSGKFIAVSSLEGLAPCDYYIITVGTPLHPETHQPRLDMIEVATGQVADHFPAGATVILRSTVQIGTTEQVVRPILEKAKRPYHLAMCPERTLEGDALRELASLPQIIGSSSSDAADRAASLFSRLTQTVVRVQSAETAEMIKLVDNTSRDVRFAFANEVARACDALGINANAVIKSGEFGYPRTQVGKPGLVGGPCLEKDPHILMASLEKSGISLEITGASRLVNERQPSETVTRMVQLLDRAGVQAPYTVAVVGLAFKGVPETSDLRGSMSLKVIDALIKTGRTKEIRAYDPVTPKTEMEALPYKLHIFDELADAARAADLLVIANNHRVFSTVSIDQYVAWLSQRGIIYDYWNNLAKEPAEKLRGRYFTVGNASWDAAS